MMEALPPPWPQKLAKQLTALDKKRRKKGTPREFLEQQQKFDADVAAAFLEFMVQVLGGYRPHVGEDKRGGFDVDSWIAAQHPKHGAIFTKMQDTQLFNCWLDEAIELAKVMTTVLLLVLLLVLTFSLSPQLPPLLRASSRFEQRIAENERKEKTGLLGRRKKKGDGLLEDAGAHLISSDPISPPCRHVTVL